MVGLDVTVYVQVANANNGTTRSVQYPERKS